MKRVLISIIMLASVSAYSAKDQKSKFEQLELFNKVYNMIQNQYYRKVDRQKLIEGALTGMMNTLDPHSAFLNDNLFEKMKNDTSGEFGGIGIEVTQKDGYLYIITAIDDTPAFYAGLKGKDKIVEIDHESILGLTLEQSIEKMKGKSGKKLTLGIVRDGESGVKHFVVKRERIKVKPVKYELISNNYAFLRLTAFQSHSTEALVEALKNLKKKSKKKGGIKGIVLDLRSNPGGLLDQAVSIASLFLKEGVVVSTESRDESNKDIRYVKKTGYKDLNTPIVVLINGSTASASEIVAGALQDHKRALIVGKQSFGKGSVQTVVPLDEKVGVKLTIAQYMTPLKRKIQAIGIKPDVDLDSIDYDVYDQNVKQDSYLREKDLRNHLTATIETSEEKEQRIAEEKVDRVKRIAELKAKQNGKKKVADEIFKKHNPKKDYQVLQSIKILQSYGIFTKLKT
jgi:carboxyl-terminal processing protease